MSINVRNAHWSTAGQVIVDGVSIAVPKGGILGLLGPNGSGKSSLLRLICKLRKLEGGSVTLGDADIATLTPRQVAQRAAFVEQQVHTEIEVTVGDVVQLGRTPHRGPLAPWSQEDEDAVSRALAQAGLAGMRDRLWRTLSGGEKQRVQIARALAQSPHELLLDEPTNHLDIQHQLEILSLVSRLTVTAIVALHDLNLAAMFCDTLVVLKNGRVVAQGHPEEVLSKQLLRDVFGVDAHIQRSPHHGKLQINFLPSALAMPHSSEAA